MIYNDSVNQIFLNNGVPDPLLSRFKPHLSTRFQIVIMYNYYLTPTAVQSATGVLQKRHFPPWSFATFILTDVNQQFFPNCKLSLFADDLELFEPIKRVTDGERLQNRLNTFYAINNNLSINEIQ